MSSFGGCARRSTATPSSGADAGDAPLARGAADAGLVRRRHRTRRPHAVLAVVAALVLLAVGIGVAAFAAGDGFGPAQVRSEREARRSAAASTPTTSTQATTTEAQTEQPPGPDGVALNRDGFARMQAGDYTGALLLLRQSVLALSHEHA